MKTCTPIIKIACKLSRLTVKLSGLIFKLSRPITKLSQKYRPVIKGLIISKLSRHKLKPPRLILELTGFILRFSWHISKLLRFICKLSRLIFKLSGCRFTQSKLVLLGCRCTFGVSTAGWRTDDAMRPTHQEQWICNKETCTLNMHSMDFMSTQTTRRYE